MLRAIGTGVKGYEKPNRAQTANIKNIPDSVKRVTLDNFIKGDKISSEMVEISMRKRGKKNSPLKRAGLGGTMG